MCLGYNETGQQHTGPACPRSPWVAGTRTHRAVPQADFCGLAPPSLRSLNEYAPSFMLGPVLGASHACGIGVSQLPHEVSRSSFPFYRMRNRLTQKSLPEASRRQATNSHAGRSACKARDSHPSLHFGSFFLQVKQVSTWMLSLLSWYLISPIHGFWPQGGIPFP